ncbi:MAG: efflux RND transporter periplasmic adaptor subunit [Bacteroidia bacterium]|nr:efflux RND transporter periplasmic adaptor subunit [Bacteroidia bacterium]
MKPHLPLWVAICGTFLLSCGEKYESANAERKNIVHSVYASGKVKALNQYEVRPLSTGRFLGYTVKEGETVKVGQEIGKISTNIQLNNIELAEMQSQQAELPEYDLMQLRNQILLARKTLEQDSIDYERQNKLFSEGIGSKNQLELRKLKLEASKSQLTILTSKRLQLQKQKRYSQKIAELNESNANENLKFFKISSEIEGQLFSLPLKKGDLVGPQQIAAVVGSGKSFFIELEIDEVDLDKIKLGQEVWIKMDAFSKSFNAKISKITPAIDVKTQSFKAEAVFTENIPFLVPGLTAEANIVIETKNNALVIPQKFLKENNQVETSEGLKTISTGLKSELFIEVLDGLKDGETVLLPLKKKK